MTEFLLSLLLLILSLQPVIPDSVKDRLSQNLIQSLQNAPNIPSEHTNPQEVISENLSPTQLEDKENKNYDNPSDISSTQGNTNDLPDTQKDQAYNVISKKPVGGVANVAIQNSYALIPCSENPQLCSKSEEPSDQIYTPTPNSTPTPIPSPVPETDDPVVIEPPVPIPSDPSITPPHNPCHCVPGKDIVCLMIYPCFETD